MAPASLTPAARLRLYRNILIRRRLALLMLRCLGLVFWLLTPMTETSDG